MKKKPQALTPEEIHASVILSNFNRVKLQHNLGKIKTFLDYQRELGIISEPELLEYYPQHQLNAPITYAKIQEDQKSIISSLEEAKSQKDKEIAFPFITPSEEAHEYPEGNFWPQKEEKYKPENNQTIVCVTPECSLEPVIARDLQIIQPVKQKDRIFISPGKQKAKLFPFQNKATGNIVDNIELRHLRAQLLLAGVGIGKTYIVGAAIRYLFDKGFFSDSISPWPCVWITRASIVEQTKRVCEKDFGLDIDTEVEVFNVEQLRSSFGEQMLKEEVILEQGEEHIVWKWRKNLPPKLIILDECQLAKNEQSTQSKIIQSIANIEEYIHLLCMSATPFTRVAESKYFCVNTHMEI